MQFRKNKNVLICNIFIAMQYSFNKIMYICKTKY